MRIVAQRVSRASVTIDGKVKSAIGPGMMILLGVEEADNEEDVEWLCAKLSKLRIFSEKSEETEDKVEAKTEKKAEREILYINVVDESLQDEILDTLESYAGEVEVKLIIKGKAYNVRERVRLCKALFFELYSILEEKNVKIVKK